MYKFLICDLCINSLIPTRFLFLHVLFFFTFNFKFSPDNVMTSELIHNNKDQLGIIILLKSSVSSHFL